MGWSKGSSIFNEIIKSLLKHVPDENTRYTIYCEIIPVFFDSDWDTENECVGLDPAYDRWYNEEFYPEIDHW